MTEATARRPRLPRRPGALTSPPEVRLRLTRHRVVILVILVLGLAFYVWTAYTAGPFTFNDHQGDVYNEQTTAFLHGHTYLPIQVPAGLMRLRNPYDPAQNAPYQAAYHDLALHNGHFYAPWGPTPAFTLFLVFRITGLQIPHGLAVAIYAFVGLLAAVALLHLMIRRLLPRTPDWLLVVATIGLALTNVAPFLLRRPAKYEVAISAGLCFEMLGLLALLTAVWASPVRLWRLAVGSLCLGLAIGARPTLVIGGAAALAAVLYLRHHGHVGRGIAVRALVPFILCGLLLAGYNQVRFGSPGEFGQRYQLAGLDVTKKPTAQLSYLAPGAFTYLLVPPRVALTFPHFFLMNDTEYPGTLPDGYTGTPSGGGAEPTGGMFPTMPITLLILALPVLWRRRRADETPALLFASGLGLLSLAVVFLLAIALWGTTQRYEMDFASLALLAAFLVWALLLQRSRRPMTRRTVAAVGIVLSVFGAAVGTAVSFTGYYDTFKLRYPGVFATLEDVTSPLAGLATMVAGKPVLVRVDDGAIPVTQGPQGYGNFGERGAGTWLGAGPVTVTVDAPGSQRLHLAATAEVGPGARGGVPLAIRVNAPGAPAVAVPVRPGPVRLPIRLHWGLNRIRLTIAGARPQPPTTLRLSNLVLAP